MPWQDSAGDLIAAIYDTVIDTSRWEEVVRRIVEATNFISGALLTREADAANATALCNIDSLYVDAYRQHYREIDPFRSALAALIPGEVRAGIFITQTRAFKASAFYNEFFRPQGWAEAVALGLFRTPEACGYLAFQRSLGAIWVEPPEWHLLETLAPHLKRAAELNQLLSRRKAITDSLGAAISAAGFAAFLLTEDCRVLFANAQAEALVRSPASLRCERGRLAATAHATTLALQELVRAAARQTDAAGEAGGTTELPRPGSQPLIAHVFPIAANRTVTIFNSERPAAALFVIDPAAGFDAAARRFAVRFGLTPAEKRLLVEIVAGKGLRVAALRLGVSSTTARTHAQNIFEKTGTHGQAELIRRYFESAMAGPLSGD